MLFKIRCVNELLRFSRHLGGKETKSVVLLRFSKPVNYEIQKPTDDYVFRYLQSSLADLLENKTLLQRVQKVMYGICHWWISICFGCFCVSRFVACDRNYDWRQRKTQLWRRLLNFRVRMFVKSAEEKICIPKKQPELNDLRQTELLK